MVDRERFQLALSITLLLVSVPNCNAQSQNYVAKFNANGTPVNSSVYDNGNVGVGTTNPQAIFDIAFPSALSGSTTNEIQLHTPFGPSAASVSNQGGAWGISFVGYSDNTYGQTKRASLYAVSEDDQLGYNRKTGLAFYTSDFDLGQAERLRINHVGWVGIGTTTPQGPLDINGRASAQSFKVGSSFTDLTNNAPWYGIGMSNITLPGAQSTTVQVAGFYGLLLQTAGAQMVLTQGGNIGIGTTQPSSKLEVNGSIKLSSGSGSGVVFPDGSAQTTAWTGVLCGGDYAESVAVSGTTYEPGDVLVVDQGKPEMFIKTSMPYSRRVAGIYSTKPGAIGRRVRNPEAAKSEIPMAMIGIVPTKVSTENGPIEQGDLLVTSTTLGYAMKGTDSNRLTGAVVGKALESLDHGKGVIDVLVTLQ